MCLLISLSIGNAFAQTANLAQGKSASQSSTSFGGSASRAIDGNTNGIYRSSSTTHTNNQAQPWWQVDLGSINNITHINLYNRTDNCCRFRLSDFYVLISDTPFTSDSLSNNLSNPNVDSFHFGPTAGDPTRIDINANGRYVRVQLAGTNPLSLAEVEVFGGSAPPTDNNAPEVSFAALGDNNRFDEGARVTVRVDASDSNGDIRSVSLSLDDQFVRTENRAPYSWGGRDAALQNLSPGTYGLTAVAEDNDGLTSTANTTITIVGETIVDNTPPVDPTPPVDNTPPTDNTPDGNGVIVRDEAYADIPDFSHVGYLTTGELDLPNYEMTTTTVRSVTGDDWANIRNAINAVASRAPDANGYRGVVYLPDANYEVSQPITISTSGIIIEGAGIEQTTVTATWRISTGAEQGIIHVEGTRNPTGVGVEHPIREAREPGDHSLNVGSGHNFNVGDTVWVISRPTENWTDLLDVTEIWGGSELREMERRYKRTVVGVSNSTIEIDAPLVDPIDNFLVPGTVQEYSWDGVVRYVGVKNLRISSVFASDTDENHAWTAVYFENAQDSFVDSVDGTHLVYATVYTDENAYRITTIDSSYRLPRGEIRGSRRYAFTTRGQLNLFRRVHADEARHAFTANTGSAGPNAFVECVSEDDTHESGPYHRWNPGLLLDNCSSEHEIATRDRLAHTRPLRGWTGATIVFFNCEAPLVVMGTPPGLQNWGHGCIETSGNGLISTENSPGTTTIESTGQHVRTAAGFESLYDQQSHERGLIPANP